MKLRELIIVSFLLLLGNNVFAGFTICNLDCAGNGVIESEVDDIEDDDYAFALRYESDSVGNKQYYLVFRIADEKHIISRNRLALFKFENQSTLELKAEFQEFVSKTHLSRHYRQVKRVQSFLNMGRWTAKAYEASAMMDDEDKYETDFYTFTYYPISEEQIQMFINNRVIKMRFDTSENYIDTSSKKLKDILEYSYRKINNVLSKNVRKDF